MELPEIDVYIEARRLELAIASTRETIKRAKAFLEGSRRRTERLWPEQRDDPRNTVAD